MEKIEDLKLELLSIEDAENINGGSEFSEAVFEGIGFVARCFWEFSQGAANSKPLFYK